MLTPESSPPESVDARTRSSRLSKPLDLRALTDILFGASSLLSPIWDDIDSAPFWEEVDAFASMPLAALDPYDGKYIAVYKGNIVDSDRDEGKLALRFYRTFGYVPVYIHEVGVEDDVVRLLV